MSSGSTVSSRIEQAYLLGWERINRLEGWHVDKSASLACPSVDKIEWCYVEYSSSAGDGDAPAASPSGGGGKRRRKAFRVTSSLPCQLEKAAALLRDINRAPHWNKTLQAARIVKRLDPNMVITYQLTASNGGLIFPRDFIFGVKFGMIDGCFVAGGCSLDLPQVKPEDMESIVRGWNYPSCVTLRPIPGQTQGGCLFQWYLDAEFGGWVPRCIQEMALPFSQVVFVDSLKRTLEEIPDLTTSPDKKPTEDVKKER